MNRCKWRSRCGPERILPPRISCNNLWCGYGSYQGTSSDMPPLPHRERLQALRPEGGVLPRLLMMTNDECDFPNLAARRRVSPRGLCCDFDSKFRAGLRWLIAGGLGRTGFS